MPSFNAAIGTKLLLEVEGDVKRFSTSLVGYSKDKFILVTTPSADSIFSVRPALFIDHKIIVRYIEDGRANGFQSRLMKAAEDPARLLFLSYPSEIEDLELRRDKRAPCALPAELNIQSLICNSVIVDINKNGLRFHIKDTKEISSLLETNPVGRECTLRFLLPGISVPQEVSGEIRNCQHNDGRSSLGIKFTKISDEDKQKIVEYESKLII
jgi:hypothetical protein